MGRGGIKSRNEIFSKSRGSNLLRLGSAALEKVPRTVWPPYLPNIRKPSVRALSIKFCFPKHLEVFYI